MRLLFFLAAFGCSAFAADLRVGIVGTDTSHATAFTAVFNNPEHKDHIPGIRVVAAFKGGSPDIKESSERVDKLAEELRTKYNVEIVPDIATLLTKVDAVLLESVDGRTHLAQFKEIAKAGKPVFIDKPLASSLKDARAIAQIAKEHKIRWFSASSLRFSEGVTALRAEGLNGVIAWGPGPMESHQPLDLTWYGLHTVETLYALLGKGCVEVTRTAGPDADVVTGKWSDGRIGTIRLIRPYSEFGAVAFSLQDGKIKIKTVDKEFHAGYLGLQKEIVAFFQGGKAPVDEAETMEMFEFMDAAQRSREAGGKPMTLR